MWNKSRTQVQPVYPIVPEATQHITSLLEAQLGASFMLIAFWKQNYCCKHWNSCSTQIRCITCIHHKWWRNSKILRISKDHEDFVHWQPFFPTGSLKENRGGFCSQLHPSDFSEFRWITGVGQSSRLAKHSTLHLLRGIFCFSASEFWYWNS